MALHQLVLFLLFLLCGRSDCTVSIVAVQEGQSVVIPCLYQKEDEDHDKLWCRDHPHRRASTVNTEDIQSAAQVSIYDDITQSVFTVNMMNVRREDAGRYCCATKPKEAKEHKALHCLEMTITDGPSKLHVPSQMVSGHEGGTVTVHVQHGFPQGSKRQWCRLGGECVGWDTESEPLDGMTVTLSDTGKEVRVTLSGLQERNTGWYYCSMGGLQIPVHLDVTPLSVTPLSVTPLSVTSDETPPAPHSDQHVLYIWLMKVFLAVIYITCSITAALKIQQSRQTAQTRD